MSFFLCETSTSVLLLGTHRWNDFWAYFSVLMGMRAHVQDEAKDGLKDAVCEGLSANKVQPAKPQLEDMNSEDAQKLPLLDCSDYTNGATATESLMGTP